jgi:hypothetical protein
LSTEYLLEPWFVQLKPTDTSTERFDRLNAYNKVSELSKKYGLSPVRFIDEEFLRTFQNDYQNYQRGDGQAIGSIMVKLVIQEHHAGEATIFGVPCPALPLNWRKALDHCGSDSVSHWRRPILVVSGSHAEEWPKTSEIKFKISQNEQINKRNLVYIESYDHHPFCETDLDPWRLGPDGVSTPETTEALRERRLNRRHLPRPDHFLPLNLTLDQVAKKLRQRLDWSCWKQGRAYYIPHEGWNPHVISQEEWRKGNAFPKGFIQKEDRKRYYGPIDRENRIWLWDTLHNDHWDVQLPDGGHINVSNEGEIRG